MRRMTIVAIGMMLASASAFGQSTGPAAAPLTAKPAPIPTKAPKGPKKIAQTKSKTPVSPAAVPTAE